MGYMRSQRSDTLEQCRLFQLFELGSATRSACEATLFLQCLSRKAALDNLQKFYSAVGRHLSTLSIFECFPLSFEHTCDFTDSGLIFYHSSVARNCLRAMLDQREKLAKTCAGLDFWFSEGEFLDEVYANDALIVFAGPCTRIGGWKDAVRKLHVEETQLLWPKKLNHSEWR